MISTLKHPSAWIPLVISLVVIAVWGVSIVMFGPPVRHTDEGAATHLFQIWLFLEVLMLAFFAFRWFPKTPKQTLLILAIQILAVLFACAPVAYFKL